jgi:hypothetical protein
VTCIGEAGAAGSEIVFLGQDGAPQHFVQGSFSHF